MTVREIVYSVLDLVKGFSDDFVYTEEFVFFLCKRYRTFLIKKERDKEKSKTDTSLESESQQICLDLEKVAAMDGKPCTGGYYLRTKQEIPTLMEDTKPDVYPVDYYQGINICYVSKDRMRYVGTNKFLQNIIYVSLGADGHLYLNSNNPQFLYLKQLRMNATFEDFEGAADLLCDDDCNNKSCDVLDMEFPMRGSLIPPMIELVVKELVASKYQPEDRRNNAADDTPKLVGNGR